MRSITLLACLSLTFGCNTLRDHSPGSLESNSDGGVVSEPNGGGGTGGGGGWAGASDAGVQSAADASAWAGDPDADAAGDPDSGVAPEEEDTNTIIGFGGTQDFGYFRALLDDGQVPKIGDFEAEGFFSEHHTPLPPADCGDRVCLQSMLGVMGNVIDGVNCTMLQIGLNSRLSADPGSRPPLNLVVVVDVSGSMQSAGKMNFVRDGLLRMVDELFDDDSMAIITYSNEAAVAHPMDGVQGARAQLRVVVEGLTAGGGTNLYDGLQAGYQEALAHYDSGHQNRVILLSDGVVTQGITDQQQILDMSRGFNSEGVGLTTVGLGVDFDYALMSNLARQGDGNFYFVENAAAVDEVFAAELAYFTVPVAYDVEIELTEGSEYTFGRAYGSSFWEDTENGGSLSLPSVFLAHRLAHDDVGEGGTRRGGGSALLIEMMPRDGAEAEEGQSRVAEVTLRFREPGTNRDLGEEHHVLFPGDPGVLPARGHFDNEIVEKSFVMLNIYVGIERACALYWEGDVDTALLVIRRLIDAVADYADSANGGEGDVDMEFDIELLDQLAAVILMNSAAEEPEEDEFSEDPWPAD